MMQNALIFWCSDSCCMEINARAVLEDMPLTNFRKFIRFTKPEFWRNEQNYSILFQSVSEIEKLLRADWEKALDDQNRLSVNLREIKDKWEKHTARNTNISLKRDVRRAKSRYLKFQRRIPELKKIKDELGVG